ncbi:transposase [Arthrobacter sp. UYCu712]|uniref:IS110 family transposase n=1 Tax=Arthrobacter sp. UYCu712 TaxID=3156340 RepID=UPI003395F67A
MAVDVGKTVVALSVTDAGRHRLLGPVDFEMTGPGLAGVLALIKGRLAGADVPVKVGIEAAGHYHRPLLAPSVWPADWQVLELNPAHVAEQRRVQGRRRIKTDALDLEAITELGRTSVRRWNRRRAGPDADRAMADAHALRRF